MVKPVIPILRRWRQKAQELMLGCEFEVKTMSPNVQSNKTNTQKNCFPRVPFAHPPLPFKIFTSLQIVTHWVSQEHKQSLNPNQAKHPAERQLLASPWAWCMVETDEGIIPPKRSVAMLSCAPTLTHRCVPELLGCW